MNRSPGVITEGMYPCPGCPLSSEGLNRFGSGMAAQINTEVNRQISGDSLRQADDPTPERVMRCAAAVAIGVCGNIVQTTALHIKPGGRRLERLTGEEVSRYL